MTTPTATRNGGDAALRDLARWRADPDAFASEVLGVRLWSAQRHIARACRDHDRVAVRSCHAAGKTFLAAVVIAWFCYTRRDAVALTTASTFRQVRHVLWRTLRRVLHDAARPLGGDLLDTELRLGDSWYALGLSTDSPDRFQGFHAPHVLVVVDEPGAIPPPVFAAIEGVLASGRTRLLMIGNPTQPHGPFYDAFHDAAAGFRCFRISAFDTPNFRTTEPDRPELVSPAWVEARRREWGTASDLYRSRVLAQFPRAGADQLFAPALLDEACVDVRPLLENAPRGRPRVATALGVDVARYGNDATAYTWIRNGVVVQQVEVRGASLMETAGRVAAAWQADPGLAIALDDTGLGGGVTDRLRELGCAPLAVNFGAAPERSAYDATRASELFHELRDALERGDLTITRGLETRNALTRQLAGLRYRFTSDGKRALDKRAGQPGAASPDLADSLALAWAAYDEARRPPGVW